MMLNRTLKVSACDAYEEAAAKVSELCGGTKGFREPTLGTLIADWLLSGSVLQIYPAVWVERK